MTRPRAVPGGAALLRTAAVSMQSMASGAAPGLDRLLDRLARLTEAYEREAAELAERVGEQLVSRGQLTARQRGDLLQVRRALHNGSAIPAAGLAGVARLAEGSADSRVLAARLRELAAASAELSEVRAVAQGQIAHEEQRLLALPWQLLHASPAGACALRSGDLSVYGDIAERVAAGEPWTTKRMRQRSDYLWRMLTRASTNATPRGWLSHVTLLRVGQPGGWPGCGQLVLRDRAAAEAADNLDRSRLPRTEAESAISDDEVKLSFSALVQPEPACLRAWRIDGEGGGSLTEVRVRRTPMVNAVLSALTARPRPGRELLDELVGDDPDARQSLRGFLVHLLGLGMIEAVSPPRSTITGWNRLSHFSAMPPARSARQDSYVDVYREMAGGITAEHAQRLADLVVLALRVMTLADGDAPPAQPELPWHGEEIRPVLDLAADCISAGQPVLRGLPHHHDWPAVTAPDSPYGRFIGWLDGQVDGAREVDISEAALDRFIARESSLDWPADCLLRPMRSASGPVALLAQCLPAGLMDARFVPALRLLGADLPQVQAYQRFLSELSDLAGIRCVEILAPPLSRQAANAVRRPAYTQLWTGDPDPAGYFHTEALMPATYLPLSEITLRRQGRTVVAEAGGQRIWPVSHTARIVPPPWDTISGLLMLASPQPERERWRALTHSLPAFPGRDYVPRISVGGGLVISAAQWRLPRTSLWRSRDPALDKAAALLRIRRTLGLPRWVSVTSDVHDEGRVVDLASLHALRVLDRLAAGGQPALLVTELLPDQEQLAVRDESEGGAPTFAEVLLRLLPPEASGDHAGRRAGPPGPCDQHERSDGR